MKLPVRKPVTRRTSRRPAGTQKRLITGWRVVGAALSGLAAAGLLWLTSSDSFTVDESSVALSGVRYTDAQVLRSLVRPWLEDRPNIFLLRTHELEDALLELPAVAQANVAALLPDRLAVAVSERAPVFVLRSSETDFLVDSAGVLLSAAPSDDAAVAQLPVLEDARSDDSPPAVGDALAPVDLAAALKLASLEPALLGSSAERLRLSVGEEDGYVLHAEPDSWRAVFGHYTPTVRPPDIIDRQVQCLRALLGEGEESLSTIYLSPADERCGTFRAAPTPTAQPSQRPSETPDE